ncbi:MAG: hypothetical protein L6Q76_26795 [Polyangiaceae bacterium]|nr:hypothetical protein [Polyangiaceae bacterium]
MAGVGRALHVFCLDVGQGDCTFVIPPDNKPAYLFDCKDAHVARMFVRSHKIDKLAAVVFSHLDEDHVAGGEQFIKDFLSDGGSIEKVYVDADRAVSKGSAGSQTAMALLDFVRKEAKSGAFQLMHPGADPADVDRSTEKRDWSVRIIAPSHGLMLDVARSETADEPNVHSAVLRAEFRGKAVIVGGDAPLVSWAQMLSSDIAAGVFRVPHHGGALDDGGTPAGWSAQRLYHEVKPDIGVISVGTRNRHEHPRAEWVRPLFDRTRGRTGCSTVCTQLTPRCHPDVAASNDAFERRFWNLKYAQEAELAWRHLRDGRAPGTNPPQGEVPCAGSIEVVLYEDGHVEQIPEPGSVHTTHVLPYVEHPWCQHGPP